MYIAYSARQERCSSAVVSALHARVLASRPGPGMGMSGVKPGSQNWGLCISHDSGKIVVNIQASELIECYRYFYTETYAVFVWGLKILTEIWSLLLIFKVLLVFKTCNVRTLARSGMETSYVR